MWCLHLPEGRVHRLDDGAPLPLPLGMRRAADPQMHPAERRPVALAAGVGLALLVVIAGASLLTSGCGPTHPGPVPYPVRVVVEGMACELAAEQAPAADAAMRAALVEACRAAARAYGTALHRDAGADAPDGG